MNEKLAKATALKQEGNACVSRQAWEEARARYTEAIAVLWTREDEVDETRKAEYDLLLAQLYGNRSAVWFQMGDFQEALGNGIMAAHSSMSYKKGLFRVAKACHALKMFPEAKSFYRESGADPDVPPGNGPVTQTMPPPKENLASPPFLAQIRENKLPLVAVSRHDGFRRLGLQIFYSDAFGLDPLRPVCELFGCDGENDEDVRLMSMNPDCYHGLLTMPIHSELQRMLSGPNEVAIRTYEEKAVYEGMLKAGFLTRLHAYDNPARFNNPDINEIPICRVNMEDWKPMELNPVWLKMNQ
jgi:hypothetical protein